jgi:protein-tyrosine-phosphatase/predicted ATP-grasp superfamily ATP-dependent carboligase
VELRVLVLGGHANAALETAQSLGRRGACITLASEEPDCLAFRSKYVAERVLQPASLRDADAVDWLRAWERKRRFDLVVPSEDVSLGMLRALDEREPLRAKAVLPENAALDTALDKQATWDFARALGVPVPRSAVIPRGGPVPPCERFPVVLKSTRSRVLMGNVLVRLEAQLVRTPEQRLEVLESWLPHVSVQEQEFVPGRGFGIELLFDRGRPVWRFAHERIHELPLTGGGSTCRRSIEPPGEALAIAERMLRELRWHGVAMVEFRGRRGGSFQLMEINPRLWGSLALCIDSGVDFPWGLALLARGETPPPQPGYRLGYTTRDLLRDSLWQVENLRADRADPLLLTRPPLRALAGLARPLIGRESWDGFDWNDLGVTATLLRRLAEYYGRGLASLARGQARKLGARLHHLQVMRGLHRRGRPRRVLFLCYGNICRSPVARHLADRRLAGIEIDSAGFHPREGRNAPDHVRRAAESAGLDLGQHRSRRVSARDVERADLVLCMDVDNLEAVRREFPEAAQRTTLLGLMRSPPLLGIPDPYSLPEQKVREVVAAIDASIDGLSSRLETLPAHRGQAALG